MSILVRGAAFVAAWLLLVHTTIGNDLLVGSWQTDSIRRYDNNGVYLGDFVPPGGGGLDLPDGMDFGADGNLYVASSNTNQILRYDGTTGAFIDAFVNSGLSAPGNLKFGPDGMLYVCDKNSRQVLRFDPANGNLVDVFASGGGLLQPVGLLWAEGLLYVADFNGSAVRRYDATTGAYVDNLATIATPLILNRDSNGNIMVSSHNLDNVVRFGTDGTALGGFLSGGPIDCPVGYVFDGQELIVASWQNHRLLRYDAQTGTYLGEFASGNGLFLPNDLLFFPDAQVVTPDTLTVTRGDQVSGMISELNASDNADLVIRRRTADIQSITQFEVETTSPFSAVSQLTVNLEGSVFARSTVSQSIELFNFDSNDWETVDTRDASRLVDASISVSVAGDPNRFVNSSDQAIKARITFSSLAARQQFSSNTDFVGWEISR